MKDQLAAVRFGDRFDGFNRVLQPASHLKHDLEIERLCHRLVANSAQPAQRHPLDALFLEPESQGDAELPVAGFDP